MRRQFDSWVRKICWRRDGLPTPVFLGFPCGSAGKESACNARDLGLIPGLGRSPGGGQGNQSSILAWRIPMDRGSQQAIVHGVAKNQTCLSTAQRRHTCSVCLLIMGFCQTSPYSLNTGHIGFLDVP